jgi:hypothetical protein
VHLSDLVEKIENTHTTHTTTKQEEAPTTTMAFTSKAKPATRRLKPAAAAAALKKNKENKTTLQPTESNPAADDTDAVEYDSDAPIANANQRRNHKRRESSASEVESSVGEGLSEGDYGNVTTTRRRKSPRAAPTPAPPVPAPPVPEPAAATVAPELLQLGRAKLGIRRNSRRAMQQQQQQQQQQQLQLLLLLLLLLLLQRSSRAYQILIWQQSKRTPGY